MEKVFLGIICACCMAGMVLIALCLVQLNHPACPCCDGGCCKCEARVPNEFPKDGVLLDKLKRRPVRD